MNEVIAGGFAAGTRPPWSREFIRVVNWNIERGLQLPKIVKFLKDAEADLILLQELDLDAHRTGHLDISRELARSLRLNYVFGKEFVELSEGSRSSPAYHGSATFSPWPLTGGRAIRFRYQSSFWKPRWYLPHIELFQRRLGGRLALASEAVVYGRRIVTYNLHLESRGTDALRLLQLQQTVEDARREAGTSQVIICGDLNLDTVRTGGAALLKSAGFSDAVQLPSRSTTVSKGLFDRGRTIDWIYVSGGMASKGRVHNRVEASDHYPVSAEFPVSGLLSGRLRRPK
jgi:endonuclease/exonuclease/phosphatase family metal-dependent hydrolase